MPYFVQINKPIGDAAPILYERAAYGDALDLFKQKCSDYAIHASMMGDGRIYSIRLTDDTGRIIQEISIHATQRKHDEHI